MKLTVRHLCGNQGCAGFGELDRFFNCCFSRGKRYMYYRWLVLYIGSLFRSPQKYDTLMKRTLNGTLVQRWKPSY